MLIVKYVHSLNFKMFSICEIRTTMKTRTYLGEVSGQVNYSSNNRVQNKTRGGIIKLNGV